jgi:hypothetical protein
METNMRYKTMVLELLQQRPEIHEQLRRQRRLLATMEFCAGTLKELHEMWKQRLSEPRKVSDESQIAWQALELALTELSDYLPGELPPDDSDSFLLGEEMAPDLHPMPPG